MLPFWKLKLHVERLDNMRPNDNLTVSIFAMIFEQDSFRES